jgi:hypothetical protein
MNTVPQDNIHEGQADNDTVSDSYEKLHKPSSAFNSRDEYLKHELQIMQPKR